MNRGEKLRIFDGLLYNNNNNLRIQKLGAINRAFVAMLENFLNRIHLYFVYILNYTELVFQLQINETPAESIATLLMLPKMANIQFDNCFSIHER